MIGGRTRNPAPEAGGIFRVEPDRARPRRPRPALLWLLGACVCLPAPGLRAEPPIGSEVESAVENGAPACATLRAEIDALRARLDAQERRLDAHGLATPRARSTLRESRLEPVPDAVLDARRARGDSGPAPAGPVGASPPREAAPEPDLAWLADRGGVLTPRGVLTLEPEVEFTSATRLEFEFDGVSLADALQIGDLRASSSQRELFTSRMQARLGVREDLELSLDLPYVWRSDRFERRVATEDAPSGLTRRRDASGLGDVALGLHYQLPRSRESRSTLVANLRVQSDTGTSPFEIERDPGGLETELATGSGHWSIEPSLTWIAPSDPGVLYGTLSYAWNLPVDVDRVRRIGGQDVRIGRVDPGDALGIGFGVGIALNETLSFSLGYSHRYLMRGETELDGRDFVSRPVHLGELQLGVTLVARNRPVRVTTSIGVTEDAPDVRIGLSLPVSLVLFD